MNDITRLKKTIKELNTQELTQELVKFSEYATLTENGLELIKAVIKNLEENLKIGEDPVPDFPIPGGKSTLAIPFKVNKETWASKTGFINSVFFSVNDCFSFRKTEWLEVLGNVNPGNIVKAFKEYIDSDDLSTKIKERFYYLHLSSIPNKNVLLIGWEAGDNGNLRGFRIPLINEVDERVSSNPMSIKCNP